MKSEGMCEMCGYVVAVRQKAYILVEGREIDKNILYLCPACHIMFESYLKPKISTAMFEAGFHLPESWKKSMSDNVAEKSAYDLKNKSKKS